MAVKTLIVREGNKYAEFGTPTAAIIRTIMVVDGTEEYNINHGLESETLTTAAWYQGKIFQPGIAVVDGNNITVTITAGVVGEVKLAIIGA